MQRQRFDGIGSIAIGIAWWFFKGTIEAAFFEQVAKQVNAFDSLVVEYGIPLGFGIYGIWLLLKKSEVKIAPTQTTPEDEAQQLPKGQPCPFCGERSLFLVNSNAIGPFDGAPAWTQERWQCKS